MLTSSRPTVTPRAGWRRLNWTLSVAGTRFQNLHHHALRHTPDARVPDQTPGRSEASPAESYHPNRLASPHGFARRAHAPR